LYKFTKKNNSTINKISGKSSILLTIAGEKLKLMNFIAKIMEK